VLGRAVEKGLQCVKHFAGLFNPRHVAGVCHRDEARAFGSIAAQSRPPPYGPCDPLCRAPPAQAWSAPDTSRAVRGRIEGRSCSSEIRHGRPFSPEVTSLPAVKLLDVGGIDDIDRAQDRPNCRDTAALDR
jgi:hypothetical protein